MQVWDPGLGKSRFDGPGEALEPVCRDDRDILDAAVPEVIEHLGPEPGALIGLKPQARNVAGAVRQDGQCYKDCLVGHHAIASDIDPDRVREDHRTARCR